MYIGIPIWEVVGLTFAWQASDLVRSLPRSPGHLLSDIITNIDPEGMTAIQLEHLSLFALYLAYNSSYLLIREAACFWPTGTSVCIRSVNIRLPSTLPWPDRRTGGWTEIWLEIRQRRRHGWSLEGEIVWPAEWTVWACKTDFCTDRLKCWNIVSKRSCNRLSRNGFLEWDMEIPRCKINTAIEARVLRCVLAK